LCRYIASGGDDGASLLWDITTGKQVAALQSAASSTAADATVDAMAFSADSTAVAVGSRDCTVKVCKLNHAQYYLSAIIVILHTLVNCGMQCCSGCDERE
jgi:WD40 repeat protein